MPAPQKKNYGLSVSYSMGRETNLGKAKKQTEKWGALVDRFRKPLVTPEKFYEYQKLSDKDQKGLKQLGGWFMRAPVEAGKRKRSTVEPGKIITLDLDYVTPDFYDELCEGRVLAGVLHFWHTTRSHTPEKPKVRMVIRTKQAITRENYSAYTRIISLEVGIEYIDKVSARTAQMMFMPTVSVDMEKHYGFREEEGVPLDVDQIVERYVAEHGPIDDIRNLPLYPGEKKLRDSASESEDPLKKDGEVGNFCRAWSISELILGKVDESGREYAGPLEDTYDIVEYDAQGNATRATYLHGTSSHGAVIYEDKFLYSHHGSDPAQEQNLNAYDLVRIHKFGDQDGADSEDLPMSQRPSVKAMRAYLKDDEPYRVELVNSKYDIDTMLDDAGIEPLQEPEPVVIPDDADDSLRALLEAEAEMDREQYERLRASIPPKGWAGRELNMNAQGEIRSDTNNLVAILTNDARFFQKIAHNDFTGEPVILDHIKSKNPLIQNLVCEDKVNGTPWQAHFDNFLHTLLSSPSGEKRSGYGLKAAEGDLFRAVKIAARNNSFNPVIELLLKHDKKNPYDGIDHLAEFPIKYLGCPDDAFHREAFKKMLIGSVARVYRPGCKFDYMAILKGPQGMGKSTLIKMLYGAYFGEMDADLTDRRACAEQLIGKWGVEMGELSSLKKSEVEPAKQFITRTEDTTRLAYDRSSTQLPRRAMLWGSTNQDKPLRDITGNRRFWILNCTVRELDLAGIREIIPKLWAQAHREYQRLWAANPNKSLDLDLSLSQPARVIAEEVAEESRTGEIEELWADEIERFFELPMEVRDLACEFNDRLLEGGAFMLDDTQRVRRLAATRSTLLDYLKSRNVGGIFSGGQNNIWQRCVGILKSRGWVITVSNSRSGDRGPRLGANYTPHGEGGVSDAWILPRDWENYDPRAAFRPLGEVMDEDEPDPWDDLI